MHSELINRLPVTAGIYLFKDKEGRILYIGKAKSIRKRVQSYFRNRGVDWKIDALLNDFATIDYIGTKNELEALLLEAQLIAEHKPKYNVLLKNGQPFVYILFTPDTSARHPACPSELEQSREPVEGLPVIKIVRNKKEAGVYFGPFLHKTDARGAVQYLINTFQLFVCNKKIANGCLDYHLGICAGTCLPNFDRAGYCMRLELARAALKSNHAAFLKIIKEKIEQYNKNLEFEKSRQLSTYLDNLDTIFTTIKTRYSPTKYEDAIEMVAAPQSSAQINNFWHPELVEGVEGSSLNSIDLALQTFLKTDKPIRSIDCFDISHFQSSYLVGSCVRFTDGKPDKNKFRRFKIKTLTEQNDYAALQEIIRRRYRNGVDVDLILIDGGKGQLSAAVQVLPADACVISLAKREETIFSKQFPEGVKLDMQTDVGRLLIAVRDYAHHFAISYHRLLRNKNTF
jgi:excinuclease ABC subunit C